jgi:hypothetical protein
VAVVAAVAAVELVVLDEDLLLLPHAVIPALSAISANAAEMPEVSLPNVLRRLRVIRVLPPCLLCRSK